MRRGLWKYKYYDEGQCSEVIRDSFRGAEGAHHYTHLTLSCNSLRRLCVTGTHTHTPSPNFLTSALPPIEQFPNYITYYVKRYAR